MIRDFVRRLLCYIFDGHRYHIEQYTIHPFSITWLCPRCNYRCVVPKRKRHQERWDAIFASIPAQTRRGAAEGVQVYLHDSDAVDGLRWADTKS